MSECNITPAFGRFVFFVSACICILRLLIGQIHIISRVDYEQIEEREEFCYLDSVVTNYGDVTNEIDMLLGKADAAFAILSRMLAISGL